ncbi:MAG: hypothetical protein K8F59_02755 [Rhodobacteraceae bacterium]|nr:hypothetical protein [Paracoccaceae bacterium]
MIPYFLKLQGDLRDVPLDDLNWPIGRPDGLHGTIGDLGPGDHLYSFPRFWMYGRQVRRLRAKMSLMIVEPSSFHGHHMVLARLFHRRFHRVLSCNRRLLAAIPNGQHFVFGDTWVHDWRTRDATKTRMLSLIASKRKLLRGHRLRHSVVRRLRAEGIEADIMGGAYKPFEDKADGLAPYRYSLVIENSREPGYFTEKIIDAFLLNTVPIYWGAPDIGQYFDTDGIIICNSEEALVSAAAACSQADYEARAEAIAANRKAAVPYLNAVKSAARVIEATL